MGTYLGIDKRRDEGRPALERWALRQFCGLTPTLGLIAPFKCKDLTYNGRD